MTNAAFGKKVLAIAVLACLCAALIAVPAYGFYYVHDDSVSDSSDGLGSYEVFMVVDETAVGGDVHSDLMFVPAGSTADVVLTEGIISSENQNGLDAIHNYDVQSVADYLAANGYNAEISVYPTRRCAGLQGRGRRLRRHVPERERGLHRPREGRWLDRSRSLRQRGDHGDQVGRRPSRGHRRPAVAPTAARKSTPMATA